MKLTLVIVVAAALAGALVGAVVGLGLDGSSGSGTALSPEQLYRLDAPGVVEITSAHVQVGTVGSGFVIDRRGDILTNDHVVQGGTSIRVGFSSRASYPALVVGADPSSGVAVVRVKAPASALVPLRFDDSSAVAVGDPVYAIGNPFGLDRTMTSGIVSATGRDIQAPDGVTIPNAIQTDAPINHGNSGGPLLDRFGRVVGVDAQIESGSVEGNVGVGCAIPSNTARTIAAELIRSGRARHAWLGVEAETIDPSLGGVIRGLPRRGVAIARVDKGSPAAKAGLEGATRAATVGGVSVPLGGDAVVAVDGKSVRTSQQLADLIAGHKPGDPAKLTVVRGGIRRTVTVTLGHAPTGSA